MKVAPNRDMAIFHGSLQLSVPDQPRGQRMAIDAFLRSPGEQQEDNAVGMSLAMEPAPGETGQCSPDQPGGRSRKADPQRVHAGDGAARPQVTRAASAIGCCKMTQFKERRHEPGTNPTV